MRGLIPNIADLATTDCTIAVVIVVRLEPDRPYIDVLIVCGQPTYVTQLSQRLTFLVIEG